ncbi:MAG: class I SAM-dependent methyltransferase [Burkholderiales bacterium]
MMTNEAIWREFLAWLPSAPPAGSPLALFGQYGERLAAGGCSVAERARHLAVVQQLMHERTDGWRFIFNNIYASGRADFATEPTALLVSTVERLPPGRALDIGMGQGRNAVFLATRGWEVTGFDISDAGLAIARANAERAGVALTAVRASEREFEYGIDQWDLVVFTYEPFPIASPDYVATLRRSMKAGGLIVIESFSEPEGASNRTAVAIDPDRLLDAFKAFRLIHFEDKIGQPDWADERRIVRMVAEARIAATGIQSSP